MDFLAIWMTRIYNTVILIPRWLLFVLSGSVASVAINLLHRGSAKKTPSPKQEKPKVSTAAAATGAPVEKSASGVASPSQAGRRKRVKAKK
jgi:hypothetical protein